MSPQIDFAPEVSARAPAWFEATVAHKMDEDSFRLADGRQARQAASCLLRPEAGDLVLLLQGSDRLYVMAVLARAAQPAQLSVPGAPAMSLHCVGDVALTSAAGSVTLQARHVLAHAAESWVQTARHWVAQVEHGLVQAAALLHLQSEQGLITAKADLKLDAERISLG